jgi:hypothetical protein
MATEAFIYTGSGGINGHSSEKYREVIVVEVVLQKKLLL